MKYVKIILSMLFVVLFTTGCSGRYEKIPNGFIAKKLTPSGLEPEVHPAGQVWLNSHIFSRKKSDSLFYLEIGENIKKETITTLMKDKLKFTFDLYVRGGAGRTTQERDYIFNNVTPTRTEKNVVVSFNKLYTIFIQPRVRSIARTVIEKYSTEDITLNLSRIKQEMITSIMKNIKGLPVHISEVRLSDVNYPEVITKAVQEAKQRQMQIEREKAEVQIKLEKARGKEELAKADYRIKMLEAKRIRDYNKMISEGVTKDLIILRNLELREQQLAKWNGVYPTHMLGSEASVILGK